MLNLENYFENISQYRFSDLFLNIRHPWEPLKNIPQAIKKILKDKKECLAPIEGAESFITEKTSGGKESILSITRPIKLKQDTLIKGMDIFIMQGTVLEPGALIKAPTIIGRSCEVRQGAYIRGNIITGDHCVLGHTTEIKNAILLDHVEAGHFAYIGDSILGENVNLGAGTKLANLQLRSQGEKKENTIKKIVVHFDTKKFNTQLKKLGAIIGDGTEIGCNTVTSPGSLISKNAWIYPNTTVTKGFYLPYSIIRTSLRGLQVISRK